MTNRDYSKGKIDKIIAGNAPVDEKVYVGSTTKDYLSQRMTTHRGRYNNWKKNGGVKDAMVYDLFDKYGIENCSIVLIESVNFASKDELFRR